MRITNKMITTKYIRSLNNISTDLDKLSNRITSGRAFSKSSENTSAAVKAYQIRRDISKTEGYQANIQHAQSSLANSESALYHIQELMQDAKDKILQANTATSSEGERNIIATELRAIQTSLLQTLNSNASDVYYFGGTNTDTAPFTIGADGKLEYNGIALNSITDPSTLANDSMYVDIGLGIGLIPDPDPLAPPGQTIVDPGTVFRYSIPGINIVGSGTATTASGVTVSNNLYDLLGALADQLQASDYTYEKVDELYTALSTASMSVIYNLTEVGSKTSYLNFMTDRYDTRTLDLQERQVKVEGVDPAKTIIEYKSQEVAYNAALQMGTRIIQPSIFDFMS